MPGATAPTTAPPAAPTAAPSATRGLFAHALSATVLASARARVLCIARSPVIELPDHAPRIRLAGVGACHNAGTTIAAHRSATATMLDAETLWRVLNACLTD